MPQRLTMGLVIFLSVSWASAGPVVQYPYQHLRDWSAAGQTEAVRKLVAADIQLDVDTPDEEGWTALMFAAKGGHQTIVTMLLDAGADVHLENDAKETALHLAAEHGRTETVRLLLEAGADFTVRDSAGRTPLYRAIDHSHGEIIEMLQAAAQEVAEQRQTVKEAFPQEDTIPPRIVEVDPAPYTKSALKQGIEGTVVIMVLVRRDGSIGGVSVSEGLEESLDRSALQAVKKWKFEPAMRGGKAVNIVVEIEIDFRLPRIR